jgi:hypothetical protein
MTEKQESKYQRCDECHGRYLIVFECKDKKRRCARCKERFDKKEGRDEGGKGDKRGIKEAKGRALDNNAAAGQDLSPHVDRYDWCFGMGVG